MAASKDYSRSIIGASNVLQDIFCEPCEHDGRHLAAEGYCVDCSEYLCGQCYKNHTRYKAFRHHALQDKGHMPLEVGRACVKDVCLQKCAKHPLEIVKYFCWTCDSLGCTACITLEHKQCKNVDYIPKIVETKRNSDQVSEVHGKLEKMCKRVTDGKNNVRSMWSMSDELKNTAKTVLKRQRFEINKFFDDLEARMEKKINETDKSNTVVLKAVSERFDSMTKDLMSLKSDIDTKQNAGQNCEVFIAVKSADPILKKLEREFQDIGAEKEMQKYKLHPMTQIQDLMKNITEICRIETDNMLLITNVGIGSDKCQESEQVSSLLNQVYSKVTSQEGRLESKDDPVLKNIAISGDSQQVGEPTLAFRDADTPEKAAKKSTSAALKTLNLKAQIDTSTSNDSKDAFTIGIAVVQEHYTIVADINNKSVKVFDTRTKKMTSVMTMENDVLNLTDVSDDKIAVALDSAIQILHVSKSGLLRRDYVIEVNCKCDGLAYYDGKLIEAQRTQVEIIDVRGKVLKTFRTDSNGKDLFKCCYDLVISPGNKTMYVSDYSQNSVTSTTLEGKVHQIYTDPELKQPWGITVDNEGCVYVCSTQTVMIHQLSADCTKLQIFRDIFGCGITFNRNKLYIGSGNQIEIYELK